MAKNEISDFVGSDISKISNDTLESLFFKACAILGITEKNLQGMSENEMTELFSKDSSKLKDKYYDKLDSFSAGQKPLTNEEVASINAKKEEVDTAYSIIKEAINKDLMKKIATSIKQRSSYESDDYDTITAIPDYREKSETETNEEYIAYLQGFIQNLRGTIQSKSDIEKTQGEIDKYNEKLQEAIKNYQNIISEFEKKQQEIIKDGHTLSHDEFQKFQDEWNKKIKDAYAEIDFNKNKKAELEKELKALKEKQVKQQPEDKNRVKSTVKNSPKPEPLQPEPKPEPVKQEPKPIVEEKEEKTLDRILFDLKKGLGLESKDHKKYIASNIKITQQFKNKISTGNWVYNVVGFLPACLQVPFATLKKLYGKITMRKNIKERVEELKDRIEKLPEADLMVIYNEYRGNNINNFPRIDILNSLLSDRISRFVQQKVTAIKDKVVALYQKITQDFHQILIIDRQLASGELDEDTIKNLEEQRVNLISGKAQEIKEIQELQKEANKWFSGGSHGFAEDMMAIQSKMSIPGMRFAKNHKSNDELDEQQADLADELKDAIKQNDDERALAAFLKREKLLSDNTKVSRSIFGKRSTGERYYSPLAAELNYKDDPFIRDLFTSIAVAGSVINIAASVKQAQDIARAQAEANQRIDAANNSINGANEQIHSYGQQIESQTGRVLKGQEANIRQGEIGGMNTQERMDLDANNWKFTDAYREADRAAHAEYNESYWNVDSELNRIADGYGTGSLTSVQALEQMASLTNQAQSRLTTMYKTYEPILEEYAQTHPQFDLTGLQDGINTLLRDQNVMMDAAQAQVEIAKIAETLQQLNIPGDIQAINISTNIIPALIGAGSAMALVANVNSKMSMNARVGKYGNDVTAMIESMELDEIEEYSRGLAV